LVLVLDKILDHVMKTNIYILLLILLSSCSANKYLYQNIASGHKSITGVVDNVYTTTLKLNKPKTTYTLTWIKVGTLKIHCMDNKYKKGDTVKNLKVKRLILSP